MKKRQYAAERYEDLYSVNGERELRESISRFVTTYCAKTNFAGKMLELDGYALWNTRAQVVEANKARREQSTKVIQNRNHQNAERKIVQLVNEYFKAGDLEMFGSFVVEPKDRAEAFRSFDWFIRTLRKIYIEHGIELFYLYIDEAEGPDGEPIRFHYHIFVNLGGGITRDMVEDLWRSRFGIANGTRLVETEVGLTGIAKYVLKAPLAVKNRRKWACSRNMRRPEDHRSTRLPNGKTLSKKRMLDLLENRLDPRKFFEDAFPQYRFIDIRAKHSEFVGGVYLYVRMRKKDESDSRTPSAGAPARHARTNIKSVKDTRQRGSSAGGMPDFEPDNRTKRKGEKNE